MTQLALANPSDWCSIAWAASRIVCDERTVRRLVDDGKLRAHYPRLAPGESSRHKMMLYVVEVERFAEARALVAGRA
jgi:hypothetical protein